MEPRRSLLSRIGAKRLGAAVVGALVLAGVAVALVAGLSGSAKPAAKRPTASAGAPRPQTNGNGATNANGGVAITGASSVPVAYWLGMQILSTPLGAVVTTVPTDSAGDRDGFYPGDVISDIGTTDVNSLSQLRAALANVPIGHSVKVTISRGFANVTEYVKLTKRPTDSP